MDTAKSAPSRLSNDPQVVVVVVVVYLAILFDFLTIAASPTEPAGGFCSGSSRLQLALHCELLRIAWAQTTTTRNTSATDGICRKAQEANWLGSTKMRLAASFPGKFEAD